MLIFGLYRVLLTPVTCDALNSECRGRGGGRAIDPAHVSSSFFCTNPSWDKLLHIMDVLGHDPGNVAIAVSKGLVSKTCENMRTLP